MARDNDAADGILWFLVGAAVGAGVALLYAPKSGKETRKFLAKQAERGREYVETATSEIVDKSKDVYERGREVADEAAELFERGRKLVRG
jgi:gas vesicle protein